VNTLSDDDAALLDELLTGPDRMSAEAALTSLVDSRAETLGSAAAFADWAAAVVDRIGADTFVARRVREWTLFKTLAEGGPVDILALTAASNWLQRKVVDESGSAAALTVLGQAGRTKKLRNEAKTRAGRLQPPPRP